MLKQCKSNKLDTLFYPEPYKVVDERGSEVTVQSSSGERYRCNVTHVKKFHTESPQPVMVGIREESGEAKESSPSPEPVLRSAMRECHARVSCSKTLERL